MLLTYFLASAPDCETNNLIFNHSIFVLFVFLFPILITNVLIGLATEQIYEFKQESIENEMYRRRIISFIKFGIYSNIKKEYIQKLGENDIQV